MNRERTEARMTDRKALAAALERSPMLSGLIHDPFRRKDINQITDAARERLAQLPEKCEHGTPGGVAAAYRRAAGPCLNCHGTGKVYPAELVERIADTIAHAMSTGVGRVVTVPIAVAILDALNGETV